MRRFTSILLISMISSMSWMSLVALAVPTCSGSNVVPPADRAPLPATARGPEIPAKGYLVEEVQDRLYWVTDGIYNAMFLVYQDEKSPAGGGVIAVDAPPTIGERYLKAIAEVAPGKPVTHLVYTHSHTDHIGGASLFPQGITILAHQETAETLARRNDPRRPMPTVTVDRTYTLQVGDQTLLLEYKGPNHEPGNLFVYAPRQKVLMLVDVIYPGWVPYKNLGIAKDVPDYISAHDHALTYPFETLVAGHVNRLGTRDDVVISREFVLDLKAAGERALRTVDFAASARETGTEDKWHLYETYFKKVVQTVYDDVRPRWRNRLGGADTYLYDNCWVMCESLVVDFAPTPEAPIPPGDAGQRR
ncbi:MAG: MBL fold metallo-hydrolase [Armatimonadaceae bacterium]